MSKLSCILFLSISCISAQEVSVETALKTMEADVAALRVQRDKVRAEIPAPSRANAIPYTLTIPLSGILTWTNRFGSLDSGNLTLTLRHYDRITIAEPVEGGGWKSRRFPVQADGLTVKPPLLKGEIRIHIGDNIDDWVVLSVDATIKERQISGAWSTTLKGTPPATARSGVLQGANIREESASFQTLVKPTEDISSCSKMGIMASFTKENCGFRVPLSM